MGLKISKILCEYEKTKNISSVFIADKVKSEEKKFIFLETEPYIIL